MQKRHYARAHSPERRDRRDGTHYWRVRTIDGDGRGGSRTFEGPKAEAQARAYVAKFNENAFAEAVTLESIVTQWISWHVENQYRPATISATENKIRRFLNTDETGDQPVSSLVGRGQRIYDEFRQSRNKFNKERPLSSATHIYALDVARRFGAWLVKRGLLKTNPFESVEKVGRLRHGGEKRALTTTEAQAFLAAALKYRNKVAGAAAITTLFLGARASEITNRTVRDLDGESLWITGATKTKTSGRQVRLSPELADCLRQLAGDRAPEAPLFWPPSRSGGVPTPHWLGFAIDAIGRDAGFTFRCNPQMLRRTVSRLTTQMGIAAPLIQAHLGHRLGTSVTETSYVGRETVQQARVDQISKLLRAGKGADLTVPQAENEAGVAPVSAPVFRRETAPMPLCMP